jgi:hypothetical protein
MLVTRSPWSRSERGCLRDREGVSKRIATARLAPALVFLAACAGARGATHPPPANEIVLSWMPDPVDDSTFVDATSDSLLPKSDGKCAPESLDEARRRYERALRNFEDDDYELLRVELERAYALCPNPAILFNLGLVERQLHHLSRAYALLEAYLAKAEPSSERAAEVRKEMAEIEARIGWIAVECGPGVDHVIVDDHDLAALGACPFRRRVRADRGKHRVESTATMETFELEPRRTVGVSLMRGRARR